MKLNERQLTIIFCIIFALVIGAYVYVQSPRDLPPPPQETKHAARDIVPLSSDDEKFIEQMRSEKLVPLSEKDEALIQEMNASGTVKPLSAEEEAFIKK